MNRFKKEEARKRREAREGLSDLEIKHLDADEQRERLITELARKIHIEKFPEEYDHYNDSIADASDRRNGISPMSADYVAMVAHKRLKEGVTPLAANGMPTSDDTWKIAYSEAEAHFNDKSES